MSLPVACIQKHGREIGSWTNAVGMLQKRQPQYAADQTLTIEPDRKRFAGFLTLTGVHNVSLCVAGLWPRDHV